MAKKQEESKEIEKTSVSKKKKKDETKVTFKSWFLTKTTQVKNLKIEHELILWTYFKTHGAKDVDSPSRFNELFKRFGF